MVATLFASAASYSHCSSRVRHPVLPVCAVLMPFEAELLCDVVSSGHLTANFSTNHMPLLRSEHSCQHPVVSQTALTVPHIPAGFVTKINFSCKLFYNLHTYMHTHIHTYVHIFIYSMYLKGKKKVACRFIKWWEHHHSWGVAINSSHCKSPVYKMAYYDYVVMGDQRRDTVKCCNSQWTVSK